MLLALDDGNLVADTHRGEGIILRHRRFQRPLEPCGGGRCAPKLATWDGRKRGLPCRNVDSARIQRRARQNGSGLGRARRPRGSNVAHATRLRVRVSPADGGRLRGATDRRRRREKSVARARRRVDPIAGLLRREALLPFPGREGPHLPRHGRAGRRRQRSSRARAEAKATMGGHQQAATASVRFPSRVARRAPTEREATIDGLRAPARPPARVRGDALPAMPRPSTRCTTAPHTSSSARA